MRRSPWSFAPLLLLAALLAACGPGPVRPTAGPPPATPAAPAAAPAKPGGAPVCDLRDKRLIVVKGDLIGIESITTVRVVGQGHIEIYIGAGSSSRVYSVDNPDEARRLWACLQTVTQRFE